MPRLQRYRGWSRLLFWFWKWKFGLISLRLACTAHQWMVKKPEEIKITCFLKLGTTKYYFLNNSQCWMFEYCILFFIMEAIQIFSILLGHFYVCWQLVTEVCSGYLTVIKEVFIFLKILQKVDMIRQNRTKSLVGNKLD